jgi:hypothetical protein
MRTVIVKLSQHELLLVRWALEHESFRLGELAGEVRGHMGEDSASAPASSRIDRRAEELRLLAEKFLAP